MSTRAEMAAEVVTIIGNRDDLDDEIELRINWAYDTISAIHPWEDMTTETTSTVLVPGTKDYIRPSTLATTELVRVVNDTGNSAEQLGYRDYVDFSDRHPYPEGQAKAQPTEWTRISSSGVPQIRVNPIPGTSQTAVVSNGGSDYYCILSHTSGDTDDEPGVGATEATYWAAYTGDETATAWATATGYVAEKLYMTGTGKVTLFTLGDTGDSSESVLNRRLDEAIVYMASAKMFATIQEINGDAQYWQQMAMDIVDEVFGTETALNNED